jgi:hypothetical protein
VPAFPYMLRRDRERWGMRECQAAWRFGVSVREYRELEAGESFPTFEGVGSDLQAVRMAADVRAEGTVST